ncbi:MAG: ATP-dependent helicase, partial [Candidatus Doudnabacteria bacterium]|nr:ATP-dependent helicase [Candidatus Doudnabacteria bacterium]
GASDEILPRLEAAGIPFTYLANTGLYRKQLVADLIGYLKLLDNYHESGSLYRTLNFPKFRLPAQDLATLTYYSGKHTLSLYETLKKTEEREESEKVEELGKLEAASRGKIKDLLESVHAHTELAKDRTVVEVFVQVVKDLRVADMLEEETLENAQNRELLEQFFKQIEAFEQDKTTSDKSLRAFLTDLDLELRAGHDGDIKFDPNIGPETLKVLTVHAAKGLEFENVFVVNLVDQRFPTREKSTGIDIPEPLVKDILPEGDFHLQEERRLFYVALTRAKKRLYLTWSKDYGGSRAKKPSLFLQETELVPSEKTTKATGKVVFSRPESHPKRQVYQELPSTFSYSAINTFKKCPLEYKYAHYLKLPLPGAPQLSFGVTIHSTFQRYLEEYQRTMHALQMDLFGASAKPELPSFERLLELYEAEWKDEWYPSKESKEGYREKGKELAKVFYEHCKKDLPKPLFIEKKFLLKLGELNFVGKIDRADSGAEGLHVIDYKTGQPQKRKSDEDVDQLRIYQWACQEQFQEKVASLCYWYLEKNEFVEVPVASGEEIVALQESLLTTMQNIRDAVKYDRFSELHKKAKQHNCNFEDFI